MVSTGAAGLFSLFFLGGVVFLCSDLFASRPSGAECEYLHLSPREHFPCVSTGAAERRFMSGDFDLSDRGDRLLGLLELRGDRLPPGDWSLLGDRIEDL
eukprot:5786267-Amphidinium_carterae.1